MLYTVSVHKMVGSVHALYTILNTAHLQGEFTGQNIAWVFPDNYTSLLGEFRYSRPDIYHYIPDTLHQALNT